MHHNIRSGTLNGNNGGQAQARFHAEAGGHEVGSAAQDASSLGARQTRAPRVRDEASSLHSGRSQGGQASLSPFGIAGSGRARWADARRQEGKAAGTEVAPEVQAPTRPQPQAPRVVNGQTYSHRARRFSRGIHAAAIEAGQASAARSAATADTVAVPTAGVALAMPQCWQPASPAETPAEEQNRLGLTAKQYGDYRNAGPAPIRLRLSRERLGVFQALATIEQRSLEDVLADHLAETAGRLLRTRHELHLDPYDQAVLAEYIDGVRERQEEWERQETESAVRAATTPAMRQAAAAADERERHPLPDLEEWDRTLPFGAVELALAID